MFINYIITDFHRYKRNFQSEAEKNSTNLLIDSLEENGGADFENEILNKEIDIALNDDYQRLSAVNTDINNSSF